jgi:hypothetical protein
MPTPPPDITSSLDNSKNQLIDFIREKVLYHLLSRWHPIREFLNYALPLVIGVLISYALVQIAAISEPLFSDVWFTKLRAFRSDFWVSLGLIALFTLLAYFVYRSAAHSRDRAKIKAQLNLALRMFYDLMEFDQNEDETRIRCTLWAPVHFFDLAERIPRLNEIVMYQVVDYYPSGARTESKAAGRHYGEANRVFRTGKKAGDEIKCVGIVGLTVFDTIIDRKPDVHIETIPRDVTFIKYMTENWNFSEKQARKLTQDRRSYMCIPFMNRANSELLGLLYCDSRSDSLFTEEVGTKAEQFLPYFAEPLYNL